MLREERATRRRTARFAERPTSEALLANLPALSERGADVLIWLCEAKGSVPVAVKR